MTIEASIARFDRSQPVTAGRTLRPSRARRLELRARRLRRAEASNAIPAIG